MVGVVAVMVGVVVNPLLARGIIHDNMGELKGKPLTGGSKWPDVRIILAVGMNRETAQR